MEACLGLEVFWGKGFNYPRAFQVIGSRLRWLSASSLPPRLRRPAHCQQLCTAPSYFPLVAVQSVAELPLTFLPPITFLFSFPGPSGWRVTSLVDLREPVWVSLIFLLFFCSLFH